MAWSINRCLLLFQRIEREDLFSRWYIDKVKQALGENSPDYMAFLEALINFGKQRRNPASVSFHIH